MYSVIFTINMSQLNFYFKSFNDIKKNLKYLWDDVIKQVLYLKVKVLFILL